MNCITEVIILFLFVSFSYSGSSNKDADTRRLARVKEGYTSRIVGGIKVSNISHYPFMAYLHLDTGHCAGSIIGRKWILTAASCSREKMSVYIGGVRGRAGRRYEVEKQIIHPKYINTKYNWSHFDLMLLKLKNRIKFTNRVKRIALGTVKDIVNGNIGVAVGYGTKSLNASFDGVLRAVKLTLMTAEKCMQQFYSNYFSELLAVITRAFFGRGVFCAGAKYRRGNCVGDYGGGFIYNGTLLGVASVGTCGSGLHPDIYASVPYFKKWILKETGIE